jgi:hypothetical protein
MCKGNPSMCQVELDLQPSELLQLDMDDKAASLQKD